jgi:ribonuclease P protein component
LVFVLPARDPAAGARLGISVPKRVGGAVVRNRVRRRLREIFRRTRGATISAPVSLVVNVRSSGATATFLDLAEDFATTVQRALSRLPRP